MNAQQFTAALAAAMKRGEAMEPLLEQVIHQVLLDAADAAHDAFLELAEPRLTASALRRRDLALLASGGRENAVETIRSLALTAAAAPGVDEETTMIALYPRMGEAAALAVGDGLDAADLHVTLAFVGDTTMEEAWRIAEAVQNVALEHAPLEGQVGGVGSFGVVEEKAPAIYLPDVPGLVELRQAIVEALTTAGIPYGRDHGYTAHVTAFYSPGEVAFPPVENIHLPLHFDEVVVARGDDRVVAFPLAGPRPITAAATVATSETGVLVAEVARRHMPKGGYGDAAWNASTGAVYWVCADWTTTDEVAVAEKDFLSIDGVASVEHDYECCVPEGDEWEAVLCVSSCGGCEGFALTAAAEPGKFCLPAELRTKIDPVRQETVKTIIGPQMRYTDPQGKPFKFEKITDPAGHVDAKLAARLEDGLSAWENEDAFKVGLDALYESLGGEAGDLYTIVDRATGELRAIANAELVDDEYIAVHNIASAGGKGEGTALLKQIAAEAADESVGVRLLATPEAEGYYSKLPHWQARPDGEFYLPADKAKAFAGDQLASPLGITFDVDNPFIGKILQTTGSHITSVSHETQAQVREVMLHSYQEGLSIPDTAKAIRTAMVEASAKRATLIARTEMVGIANSSSLASVQIVSAATGDEYAKKWQTAPGARHPRHQLYDGLNGQVRALDNAFDVGGYALLNPGDHEGPPHEVCNCRCSMEYLDGEEAQQALAEAGAEGSIAAATWPPAQEPVVAAATWPMPSVEEVIPVGCDVPSMAAPAKTTAEHAAESGYQLEHLPNYAHGDIDSMTTDQAAAELKKLKVFKGSIEYKAARASDPAAAADYNARAASVDARMGELDAKLGEQHPVALDPEETVTAMRQRDPLPAGRS